MAMNRDYDVIVVGAGPGGSTAARLCARAGLKTLLIEKERLPRYKSCGGCLSLKTARLLGFDLSTVIENVVYGVKFTYRLRDSFSIQSREPVAFLVMRDSFDQFLVERALKEGAEILEGEKLAGARERDGCVEVETSKGERLRCQYLIGADGAGSTVAKSFSLLPPGGAGVGFGVESEIPYERAVGFSPKEAHLIHLDFGGIPNGYGWVFPKRGGLSIGIGAMSPGGKKVNPRPYFSTFPRGLAYLDGGRINVTGHSLPPFYSEGQKVSQGNVLLVGDAAHLMDPLQGEGMFYAVRSGILAAEAILKSKEEGISPSDLYQDSVRLHIFEDLKWALRFSRFVFRFTKLAYRTFKRYPEIGDFYLQVLDGKVTYQGFVTKVKERMKDLLGGKLSEKIKRTIAKP
jgi:geranylgeranyl reductase family protein